MEEGVSRREALGGEGVVERGRTYEPDCRLRDVDNIRVAWSPGPPGDDSLAGEALRARLIPPL